LIGWSSFFLIKLSRTLFFIFAKQRWASTDFFEYEFTNPTSTSTNFSDADTAKVTLKASLWNTITSKHVFKVVTAWLSSLYKCTFI
jgi:hypothetical protein